MDWKRLKKGIFNKKYGLPILLLLFVLFFGIVYLVTDYQRELDKNFPQETDENFPPGTDKNCQLQYGQHKCIEGRIVIPFHNPNPQSISSIHISIPVKNGTNIYNVSEPLGRGVTDSISTCECQESNGDVFSLEWCCGADCYAAEITKPDPRITLA